MAKKTRRTSQPDAYDWRMIQDFLEHLVWEVRIEHFEHVTPGVKNPELVHQLAKYHRKYKRTRLLIPIVAARRDKPPSREWVSAYHQAMRERLADELKALESLKPLFDVALTYIRSQKLGGEEEIDNTRMDEVQRRIAELLKEGDSQEGGGKGAM